MQNWIFFLRFPEVIQLNVNPTLVWLCISYIKTGETAYFRVTLRWFKSTLKHFWHLNISSMSRWLKHRKQNIWSLYSIRLSIWIAPNNLLSYLKRISNQLNISSWGLHLNVVYAVSVQELSGSKAHTRIKSTYKQIQQIKWRWYYTNTSFVSRFSDDRSGTFQHTAGHSSSMKQTLRTGKK